jgi:hypothetical protein
VGEAIIGRAVGEDLGDPSFWPAGRRPSVCRHSLSYQLFCSLCLSLSLSLMFVSLRYVGLRARCCSPGACCCLCSCICLAWGRTEKVTVAPKGDTKICFRVLSLSRSLVAAVQTVGFLARESCLFFSLSSAWLGVSSPVGVSSCVSCCPLGSALPLARCRWAQPQRRTCIALSLFFTCSR